MTDRLRLNFGNLPLVESAVRVSLAKPIGLTFQRIYELRAALSAIFPEISEPEGWEVPPGVRSETFSVSPVTSLTGVVYKGHPDALRLTVQNRVVVLRWGRQAPDGRPKYPRYGALRDVLWDTFDKIEAAFEETFTIAAVNMSYVNSIRAKKSADILGEYFSEDIQVAATRNSKQVHQVELSWRDQSDLDLRFRLHAENPLDDSDTIGGYNLTTIAGSQVPNGRRDDGSDYLDRVHESLQRFFVRILSPRAKKEWQLDEEAYDG